MRLGDRVEWVDSHGGAHYGVVLRGPYPSTTPGHDGVPMADCTTDTFGGSEDSPVAVEVSRLRPRSTCLARHKTGRVCRLGEKHDGDHEQRPEDPEILVERWTTSSGVIRQILVATLEEHILRPSGRSGGQQRYRLPERLGRVAAELVDAGRGDEAVAALEVLLAP